MVIPFHGQQKLSLVTECNLNKLTQHEQVEGDFNLQWLMVSMNIQRRMLPSVAGLVNQYDLTSIFITTIKTIRYLIASIINRNTSPIIAGKLQLRVALKLNRIDRNH